MARPKSGISMLSLQRLLEIKSYDGWDHGAEDS